MLTEAPTTGTTTTARTRPNWFRLLRAPRSSFQFSKVVLAAASLILLQAGWAGLDRLFPDDLDVMAEAGGVSAVNSTRTDRPARGGLHLAEPPDVDRGVSESFAVDFMRSAARRLIEPLEVLVLPLLALVTPGKGLLWYLHAGLAVVWALIVVGIAGGAIARIALVQEAGRSAPGMIAAVQFALRFALPLIATPLFPLLAIAVCGLICAGFGLLFRLPAGVGPAVGGALLFVPLSLGLVMAYFFFGLAAGWPLLVASVAAEAEDLLDALSRSLSYLNQRLGKFVVSVGLVWLLGIPALLSIDLLTWAVTHLATWGVALAAPASSLTGLTNSAGGNNALEPAHPIWPLFWRGFIALLVRGWTLAYFWTSSSFIYMLLRQDVDGTPCTEVRDA